MHLHTCVDNNAYSNTTTYYGLADTTNDGVIMTYDKYSTSASVSYAYIVQDTGDGIEISIDTALPTGIDGNFASGTTIHEVI